MAGARHGMGELTQHGMAGERHGMCELALSLTQFLINITVNETKESNFISTSCFLLHTVERFS
jgi:hypothetical protein